MIEAAVKNFKTLFCVMARFYLLLLVSVCMPAIRN
jgi:hypothetical protein